MTEAGLRKDQGGEMQAHDAVNSMIVDLDGVLTCVAALASLSLGGDLLGRGRDVVTGTSTATATKGGICNADPHRVKNSK